MVVVVGGIFPVGGGSGFVTVVGPCPDVFVGSVGFMVVPIPVPPIGLKLLVGGTVPGAFGSVGVGPVPGGGITVVPGDVGSMVDVGTTEVGVKVFGVIVVGWSYHVGPPAAGGVGKLVGLGAVGKPVLLLFGILGGVIPLGPDPGGGGP